MIYDGHALHEELLIDNLAIYGLAPALRVEVPLTDSLWESTLRLVVSNHLLPHLALAIDDGWFAATSAHRERVQDDLRIHLASRLLLERELLGVAGHLVGADIDFRVLKGSATAHLDYPNPALRPFNDLDILVRGRDIERMKTVLEKVGYYRQGHERRPGFDARFEKSFMYLAPLGYELDMHRSLVSGPFGHTLEPDDLFDSEERLTLGAATLPALAREERFIHACLAFLVGDPQPRPRPARDVAQALVHPSLDPDRVLDLAHTWQVAIVVARAIQVARARLKLDLSEYALAIWADEYLPRPREVRFLDCYIGAHKSYAHRAVGALVAIKGIEPRLSYARSLLVPDPQAVMTPITTKVRRATAILTRGSEHQH